MLTNEKHIRERDNPSVTIEDAVIGNAVTGLIARTIFRLDEETSSFDGADYRFMYFSLCNGIFGILQRLYEKYKTKEKDSAEYLEAINAFEKLYYCEDKADFNFKPAYYSLFNGILDVIENLYEKHRTSTSDSFVFLLTIYDLQLLQYKAEELFELIET